MQGEQWFVFMNHGYLPASGAVPPLERDDDRWRHQVLLYKYLLDTAEGLGLSRPLSESSLLDVGCGRGGGLSAMERLFGLKRAVGLDQSERQIEFCRERHGRLGIEFHQGSALALPFADQTFDLVSNVESSHLYPNVEKFLSEVRRVLKDSGMLLFTDARDAWFGTHLLERQMRDSGLTILRREDITDRVLAACREDATRFETVFRDVAAADKWKHPQAVARSKARQYRLGVSRYEVYILRKDARPTGHIV